MGLNSPLPSSRGLFRRRTLWFPTWRLTLPALLVSGLVLFLGGRSTHAFLSLTQRVEANVLVVEGWSPDYALEEAVQEFNRGDYVLLIASGGPMQSGSLVTGFQTYAELAEASLRQLGVEPANLVAAPAEKVYRNRTYVSAVSVRDLLAARKLNIIGVNIVSVGPHARRSWVVYSKVLQAECPVGIIALPPQDYDARRWWASSDGVKTTLTEALGWIYEVVLDGGR